MALSRLTGRQGVRMPVPCLPSLVGEPFWAIQPGVNGSYRACASWGTGKLTETAAMLIHEPHGDGPARAQAKGGIVSGEPVMGSLAIRPGDKGWLLENGGRASI